VVLVFYATDGDAGDNKYGPDLTTQRGHGAMPAF
jgi:hypothetical protein